MRHVCLRNPCLLWNLSLHFLPEAWGPWERRDASPARWGCIMLAKDRVVVSKLWITGYSLWSRLSYRCDSCKPMKNCWESAFSLCGLEVGLPAFQLPMFAKCDALPKRNEFGRLCFRHCWKRPICDMLYFRNPFPSFFARTLNSLGVQRVGKGDLLSREAQSSSNMVRMDVWVVNQWWIRMIIVCIQIWYPCWIQASHACHSQVSNRFFGLWSPRRSVVASFNAAPWSNEELPAFQLPMFAKCDAIPKRIELDMFCFRNPVPLFFAKAFNSLGVQRVGKGDLLRGELQSSLNIVRIDVWVVN